MNLNQVYSAAEVERMMKLQDVLLKAVAGKMHWWEAAEIIGVSDRTMRRWRERLQQHGYDGLTDRRKGKCSQRRVPPYLDRTCARNAVIVPGRGGRGGWLLMSPEYVGDRRSRSTSASVRSPEAA